MPKENQEELYQDVLEYTINRIVQDLTEFGRLEELIYQYENKQDGGFILPTKIEKKVKDKVIDVLNMAFENIKR